MRYKIDIKQLTFISVSQLRTMLRTYKKKSDILVALGKASDDTRYLDRAMERGEVVKLNIN
jgi:predicted GTPase